MLSIFLLLFIACLLYNIVHNAQQKQWSMVSHVEVYCSLNQFPTETSSFLCTPPLSKSLHTPAGQTLCTGGGLSIGHCPQAMSRQTAIPRIYTGLCYSLFVLQWVNFSPCNSLRERPAMIPVQTVIRVQKLLPAMHLWVRECQSQESHSSCKCMQSMSTGCPTLMDGKLKLNLQVADQCIAALEQAISWSWANS